MEMNDYTKYNKKSKILWRGVASISFFPFQLRTDIAPHLQEVRHFAKNHRHSIPLELRRCHGDKVQEELFLLIDRAVMGGRHQHKFEEYLDPNTL
jgi:hypothetical protein